MRPSPEKPRPDPIALRDGKIIYSETGSFTLLPSETIQRAEKVLQKIGVVSVEQIDPKYTDGVPIFKLNEAPAKARCHRQACYWSFPPTLLNNPPRESFGKGMTVEQSKASAMMEAVERFCGQKFPHHQVIQATYEDVRYYAIPLSKFNFPLPPPKCENCGEKDWDCFADLQKVCQEWSWGYSLTHRRPVLIPAALVYYPYISKDYTSFMYNDTGGLSAGNTIEEAILQGIAEVIERDALYFAFNLGNLKDKPILDFRCSKNRYIQKFIRDILPPERVFSFQIKNETLNLAIPTFTAFVCYLTENGPCYFGGSGTSLDPEVGLLRALTELEQQKIRQKFFVAFDPNQLVTHNNPGPRNTFFLGEKSNQSTGNVKQDIELLLGQLLKEGMDVIVVDLTHPEIGIPVVRVIIPQLISYSGSPIKESLLKGVMMSFGAGAFPDGWRPYHQGIPSANSTKESSHLVVPEKPVRLQRVQREEAEIHWGDETGLSNGGSQGRSYAPQGETPAVRVCVRKENHGSICLPKPE